MNLARLADYARERALSYGWRARRIAWALDITRPAAPAWEPHGHPETVPYVRRSGTAPAPRPGADTVDYITGRHRRAWLRQCAALAGRPGLGALAAALHSGALEGLAPPPGAKGGDLVAVRAGGVFLHETPALAAWWREHLRADLDTGREGICLCCARGAALARLVPAYLPGAEFGGRGAADRALAPGTGARSADSAPVCVDCATAIGAALPALAADPAHHHRTTDGDLLLWWGTGGPGLPLGRLLGAANTPGALDNVAADGHTNVVALRPSGTGRIAVTGAVHEPSARILSNLRRWYERGAVDVYGDARIPGLPLVWRQLGHWDPAAKDYRPLRAGGSLHESGLWLAVLTGRPAPAYAYAATRATRADQQVPPGRVALLQSFPLRPMPGG